MHQGQVKVKPRVAYEVTYVRTLPVVFSRSYFSCKFFMRHINERVDFLGLFPPHVNLINSQVNELLIITTRARDENVTKKRVPSHGRPSDEKSVQSRGTSLLLSLLPPHPHPPTCSLPSVREHGWNSIIGSRECGG